jgi:hypothetical protein
MSGNKRHWSVNPVEVAIFSAVALIGVNSLYSLFSNSEGFQAAALSPMSANPVSEGRSPASIGHSAANIDTNCDDSASNRVSAGKIRLAGPICPEVTDEDKSDSIKPQKVEVKNETNNFAATVFIDKESAKYSTDYIPLSAGVNKLSIQFVYPKGKAIAQKLELIKE